MPVIRRRAAPRTNRVDLSLGSLGDSDLARAIVAGRHEALKEAYDRHGASVFTVARRVTQDPALAEDVAQEVFLRLWRWPERFDANRGSLRALHAGPVVEHDVAVRRDGQCGRAARGARSRVAARLHRESEASSRRSVPWLIP